MSMNNGTINALIQLNGGAFDSTKQLEEREPFITSDYYLYVGQGVDGNLPIAPLKVRQADKATLADTLVAGNVEIRNSVIKVSNSITIQDKSIKSNTVGNSTLEGFNIKSNSIVPASGTGNVSTMNLVDIRRIQLVKGQSYGTEAEKNALTDVQVGQLFFVVG